VAVGTLIGAEGAVRRWFGAGAGLPLVDGGQWQDVWALSPDVWIAVGGDSDTGVGTALHSGVATFEFDEVLRSVAALGPDSAFAAGESGRIYQWDGVEWSVGFPGDGVPVRDLWTAGSTDLYAVLDAQPGRVVHFDGQGWSELPHLEPPCDGVVERVWASGPDSVFVVGFDVLARFDGSAWTCYDDPDQLQGYLSVWGSGPDDAWIVDYLPFPPRARLLHWDGTDLRHWAEADPLFGPATFPGDLIGTAADDVFLGSLAHFDGQVWSPIRSEAMEGSPVFAIPSRIFMLGTVAGGDGISQFIRTRFWNQRAREADCGDGVDDDADGATDSDDSDCRAGAAAASSPSMRSSAARKAGAWVTSAK